MTEPILIDSFRSGYPFTFDPFQDQAIEALHRGQSVLVSAPTGTGKTVVAEYAVHRAMAQGKRALYTTPLKALSNQKFRDFRKRYGAAVGLLTGDIVVRPSSRAIITPGPPATPSPQSGSVGLLQQSGGGQVIVMTTEVLRNMLLQEPEQLNDVGCVVFDEIHYMSDPERGTTWEEAIICCPPHVQLVCLSATVANADEIARWLSAVHRDATLIYHGDRAVPLEHYYFLDGKLHLAIDVDGRRTKGLSGVGGEARRFANIGGRRAGSLGRGGALALALRREPEPADIVLALHNSTMLPAIYFVFSRRHAEAHAESCARLRLIDPDRRLAVEQAVEACLLTLAPEDRALNQVRSLTRLLPTGVGFHHAGLLPLLKVLVEDLFCAGLIGVVFATDTLSLGINMPARAVVIGELSKFDGEARRLLTPNEYRQLTGRAGRRGIDELGAAVIPYSAWMPATDALAIATGPIQPVESAFSLRYNSVLNLWSAASGEDDPTDRLVKVISSSFREFQLDGELQTLRSEMSRLDREIAEHDSICAVCPPDSLATYEWHRRALPQAEKELARAERAEAKLKRRERLAICELPNSETRGESAATEFRQSRRLGTTVRRVAKARERLREIEQSIIASLCSTCSAYGQNLKLRREANRQRSRRREIGKLIQQATRQRQGSIRQTIRSVQQVLERFGYIQQGRLTEKALVFRNVFDPNGLILCEALEQGLLNRCSPCDLAEVISWFAYDREQLVNNRSQLPYRLRELRKALETIENAVLQSEAQAGLSMSPGHSRSFYGAALSWCQGATFEQVLSHIGVAEGNVMLAFNKTLDLMRQIRDTLRQNAPESHLIGRLIAAEAAMRRGIVEQCCQIGVSRLDEAGDNGRNPMDGQYTGVNP